MMFLNLEKEMINILPSDKETIDTAFQCNRWRCWRWEGNYVPGEGAVMSCLGKWSPGCCQVLPGYCGTGLGAGSPSRWWDPGGCLAHSPAEDGGLFSSASAVSCCGLVAGSWHERILTLVQFGLRMYGLFHRHFIERLLTGRGIKET